MFRNLIYVLLAVAAMVAGVLLYQFSQASAEPELALVYPQPRALADFTLTDQHGETVNRERLYNQWTLAFVGYTYCPDICPLTLAKLAGVQPDLAAMVKQPLKVWFISVDPNRDTTEQLNNYVSYFEQAQPKTKYSREIERDLEPIFGLVKTSLHNPLKDQKSSRQEQMT